MEFSIDVANVQNVFIISKNNAFFTFIPILFSANVSER